MWRVPNCCACQNALGSKLQHCTPLQVAHFLEADLQPWAAALAAKLFPSECNDEQPGNRESPATGDAHAPNAAALPQQAVQLDTMHRSGRLTAATTAPRLEVWRRLDALTPLGDAVDTVLRASRLPLLEQLPRTPAEWRPALIGSHAVAGALALHATEAAACCDAMHAVRDVHSLTLDLQPRDAPGSVLSPVPAQPRCLSGCGLVPFAKTGFQAQAFLVTSGRGLCHRWFDDSSRLFDTLVAAYHTLYAAQHVQVTTETLFYNQIQLQHN